MTSLKTYYRLTKPGIVYSNCMTAAAGFLLASRWRGDWVVFATTIIGTGLVIAAGCVFNNYIDRGIDAKMARTRKRGLVTGEIPVAAALTFGVALALLGFVILASWVSWLVVALGVVALVSYVVVYGLAKRRTVHGTLVGTIPGALPPVAGYCAAAGHLDGGALALFLILVCWQMPHFYAIAMFRRDDYRAAGLPVLPVVKGMHAAKVQIMVYILLYIVAIVLLAALGYAGWVFAVISGAIGLVWLWRSWGGFRAQDDIAWARRSFGFSLLVLLTLSVTLSVGSILP